MEIWNTLCPISSESLGSPVQTSSATSHLSTSIAIHRLYAMSWNIYICVHFTSTINISIFTNFLEGKIHFPGYFSEPLSNLGKFLSAPNTNHSKPGLGLGSVLLLLLILKSRKMKSRKKINRNIWFAASSQIMHLFSSLLVLSCATPGTMLLS